MRKIAIIFLFTLWVLFLTVVPSPGACVRGESLTYYSEVNNRVEMKICTGSEWIIYVWDEDHQWIIPEKESDSIDLMSGGTIEADDVGYVIFPKEPEEGVFMEHNNEPWGITHIDGSWSEIESQEGGSTMGEILGACLGVGWFMAKIGCVVIGGLWISFLLIGKAMFWVDDKPKFLDWVASTLWWKEIGRAHV